MTKSDKVYVLLYYYSYYFRLTEFNLMVCNTNIFFSQAALLSQQS